VVVIFGLERLLHFLTRKARYHQGLLAAASGLLTPSKALGPDEPPSARSSAGVPHSVGVFAEEKADGAHPIEVITEAGPASIQVAAVRADSYVVGGGGINPPGWGEKASALAHRPSPDRGSKRPYSVSESERQFLRRRETEGRVRKDHTREKGKMKKGPFQKESSFYDVDLTLTILPCRCRSVGNQMQFAPWAAEARYAANAIRLRQFARQSREWKAHRFLKRARARASYNATGCQPPARGNALVGCLGRVERVSRQRFRYGPCFISSCHNGLGGALICACGGPHYGCSWLTTLLQSDDSRPQMRLVVFFFFFFYRERIHVDDAPRGLFDCYESLGKRAEVQGPLLKEIGMFVSRERGFFLEFSRRATWGASKPFTPIPEKDPITRAGGI